MGTDYQMCFARFTIVANIIMMMMMHSRISPQLTHYSFLVPFVVIRNTMACKVYRDIKLGLLGDEVSTYWSSWSVNSQSSALRGSRPCAHLYGHSDLAANSGESYRTSDDIRTVSDSQIVASEPGLTTDHAR